MISTDVDSEVGSGSSAGVVFVEIANFAVLDRTGHDIEVGSISHCLECSAIATTHACGTQYLKITTNDD